MASAASAGVALAEAAEDLAAGASVGAEGLAEAASTGAAAASEAETLIEAALAAGTSIAVVLAGTAAIAAATAATMPAATARGAIIPMPTVRAAIIRAVTAQYGSVNRGQLNGFLGLPTDGGLGAGTATFANHGLGGGRRVANYGTHPFSQTWAHSQGQNVQNWASNHPEATQAWNNAKNSWAWTPNGVDAAAWGTAAWAAAGWPTLNNWLGWGDTTDYPYDYGNNITYDGDNVYYNSQPAGTAEQYYQEASNLASTTSSTPSDSNSGDWLPLGIFGLVEGDSKTPTRTFQIAVNKDGTIRGNSANQYGNVLPIHGAVQKRTQRVCWTVGTDTSTVYDTGLYNLTKSESPILVHTGPKQTQQELLVRMKQPAAQSGNGSISSTK